MDTREWLARGFDYELWANQRWIQALGKFTDPKHARSIMEHILMAQRIWYSRCLSTEEMPEAPDDLEAGFVQIHAEWRELIRISDPTAFISYNSFDGASHFSLFEDVVRHVLNHGTYHRGHLRGLADAQGLIEFPETDFIKFSREDSGVPVP